MSYGPPYDLAIKVSLTGVSKKGFSDLPTAAHVAVSLNTITQKPIEYLHIYVSY